MLNILDEYRARNLILLVGGNPLPNYVAAMLLARDDGTIYMMHSPGKEGTLSIAERLEGVLSSKHPLQKIVKIETDDTDGALIRQTTRDLSRDMNGTIGVHYTSGTKPMTRHVTRELEARYPSRIISSYLDPRHLELVIEPPDATQPQYVSVGRQVSLDLNELLELHGYKLSEIQTSPRHLQVCQTLKDIHKDSDGLGAWRKYVRSLGDSGEVFLPADPKLQPVNDLFARICGNAKPTPQQVAEALGQFDAYVRYSKFFKGEWLENYGLDALSQAAQDLNIIHYGANLIAFKPASDPKQKPVSLELDLAVMHSYQLFAISCRATDSAAMAKEHFLEVYVRAQQLGGDEARVGLICFLAPGQAMDLQREVEQAWDAQNRIKIFGREDMDRLAEALKDWIKSASNPPQRRRR
jgi:hypothetical protein